MGNPLVTVKFRDAARVGGNEVVYTTNEISELKVDYETRQVIISKENGNGILFETAIPFENIAYIQTNHGIKTSQPSSAGAKGTQAARQ